jgi:hypothetical protein
VTTTVQLLSVAEQVTAAQRCRRARRAGVVQRWRMSTIDEVVTVTIWWPESENK